MSGQKHWNNTAIILYIKLYITLYSSSYHDTFCCIIEIWTVFFFLVFLPFSSLWLFDITTMALHLFIHITLWNLKLPIMWDAAYIWLLICKYIYIFSFLWVFLFSPCCWFYCDIMRIRESYSNNQRKGLKKKKPE